MIFHCVQFFAGMMLIYGIKMNIARVTKKQAFLRKLSRSSGM